MCVCVYQSHVAVGGGVDSYNRGWRPQDVTSARFGCPSAPSDLSHLARIEREGGGGTKRAKERERWA